MAGEFSRYFFVFFTYDHLRLKYSRGMEAKMLQNIICIIKWFFMLYAMFGNTVLSENAFNADTVSERGFSFLHSLNGWGMEKLLFAAGITVVFYLARNASVIKNKWLKGSCAFLAVCTIVGQSYLACNSWDAIFGTGLSFLVAALTAVGYYYTYLHFLALGISFLQKRPDLLRTTSKNKAEKILFEQYPFLLTAGIALLCQLPYIIAFFPGTLQCDALGQLWQAFGIMEIDGHHPVLSTKLMGKCIFLGKQLFHSDSIGMFLFTGYHSLLQSLAIAYLVWFFKKLKAPILIRWFTLLYFLLLPLFPMWGLTFVKDTPYYIYTLLFITTLANILYDDAQAAFSPLWQKLLLIISALAMAAYRNNGVYVIVLTAASLFFLCRHRRKLWVLLGSMCFLACFFVEKIYLPSQNIPPGEVGEALSVPLQQTARYLAEHGDEVTDEENAVLEEVFSETPSEIAARYEPEVSDPVKELFLEHPSSAQLKAYFTIWWKQFLKHPDTYIQAFLNQTYGYFYPNRKEIQPDLFIFRFNGWEKWDDGTLLFEHAIDNPALRDFLEDYCYSVYTLPVISMFFSAGFHVYLLLGCVLVLAAHKKWRQLSLYVPSLIILLVCLVSPVNAKIRYMFPIMAVLPLNLAWCVYAVKKT